MTALKKNQKKLSFLQNGCLLLIEWHPAGPVPFYEKVTLCLSH